MAKQLILLLVASIISLAYASIDEALLPGHLKPFGAHMDPKPVEESEEIPDAKTFFEKYVLPSRPIVFRGAAKKFKAFSEWTEDYLVKNYGDLEIRLENKLEKEGFTPKGAKGVGRDTVEEFIKTYHNEPKYIVSELPSPMYKDIMALPCMSCGPLKQRMVEIDLWMSSGSSQSILHKDAFNTMNCLINGTKDWKLVPYSYEKDLYKAYEEGDPAGGYSKINVRSVDMAKYPKIASLPYYNITVHGGDCLFLPKSCYHQVNSHPGFNLAVTILFSRFDFDKPTNFKDCNSTTEKFTSLTKFNIDWQYPGKGYMTMGYGELFLTKSQLYRQAKYGELTVDSVLEMALITHDPFTGEKINKQYIRDIFGIKKGQKITKEMVKSMKKTQLRKVGALSHELFSSNSYDYEYFKISASDLAKMLSVLMKDQSAINKDTFIEWYTKKLYGTAMFGDNLFKAMTGSEDAKELTKQAVLKNFASATERYVGDDSIEGYDTTAKHAEKEDRGDAYIFVRKDLPDEKDEELFNQLFESIPEEKRFSGRESEADSEDGEDSQDGDDDEADDDIEADGDSEADGDNEADEDSGTTNTKTKDEL